MKLITLCEYKCVICKKTAHTERGTEKDAPIPEGWCLFGGSWVENLKGDTTAYPIKAEACSYECMKEFISKNLCNPNLK